MTQKHAGRFSFDGAGEQWDVRWTSDSSPQVIETFTGDRAASQAAKLYEDLQRILDAARKRKAKDDDQQ